MRLEEIASHGNSDSIPPSRTKRPHLSLVALVFFLCGSFGALAESLTYVAPTYGPRLITSSVGRLEGTDIGGSYVATANVISRFSALTAAHCLWDPLTGWGEEILFRRGYQNGASSQVVYPGTVYILGGYQESSQMDRAVGISAGRSSYSTFSRDIGLLIFSPSQRPANFVDNCAPDPANFPSLIPMRAHNQIPLLTHHWVENFVDISAAGGNAVENFFMPRRLGSIFTSIRPLEQAGRLINPEFGIFGYPAEAGYDAEWLFALRTRRPFRQVGANLFQLTGASGIGGMSGGPVVFRSAFPAHSDGSVEVGQTELKDRSQIGVFVGGSKSSVLVRSINASEVIRFLDYEIENVGVDELVSFPAAGTTHPYQFRAWLSPFDVSFVESGGLPMKRGDGYYNIPILGPKFVDGATYYPFKYRWRYTGARKALVRIRHIKESGVTAATNWPPVKASVWVSPKYPESTISLRFEVLDRWGRVLAHEDRTVQVE